ncbi:lymphocyte antigen 75 [Brienomyrus brachyistius]|uniref:lymphocyte antigen 75 n=1 Tax=Brienomyrus brachyistius TaxID=42636 RepID=UPI0020B3A5C2|nr:lymphocyte antigen 75 [Brienomyrus brachyistius]
METTTLTIILIAGLFSTHPCLGTENILIMSKLDWYEAQTYCRTYYGDLSTITNGEEQDQINNIRGHDLTWIGLYRDPNHPSEFIWSDGDTSHFQAWGDDQPNDLGGIQNCVRMEDMGWNDYDCFDENYFFCSIKNQEMVVVENPMTWEEALVYCRNHYQDLVSLASETKLILALQKTNIFQGMYFWTGLRFLDDSWLWVDGEQLRNGSWSADPLPKCPAEPFRCGALSTITKSQEVWSCEERLSYICNT